jgi:hypothetical protein
MNPQVRNGLVGVALLAALPVSLPGVTQAVNRSRGGADLSRTSAGVQARWQEGAVHSGIFMGGAATLDQLGNGRRPSGAAALIVAVGERAFDAKRLTYVWTPHGAVALRDLEPRALPEAEAPLRDVLRRGAARFAGMLPAGYDTAASDRRAPTPPASARGAAPRGAGSMLAGLPAVSRDGGANVVQAGWIDGRIRYGVLARGPWSLDDEGELDPGAGADWIVVFRFDIGTERAALFELDPAAGSSGILWEEGRLEASPRTPEWVAEAVRGAQAWSEGL